jgi:hypothetical protein
VTWEQSLSHSQWPRKMSLSACSFSTTLSMYASALSSCSHYLNFTALNYFSSQHTHRFTNVSLYTTATRPSKLTAGLHFRCQELHKNLCRGSHSRKYPRFCGRRRRQDGSRKTNKPTEVEKYREKEAKLWSRDSIFNVHVHSKSTQ